MMTDSSTHLSYDDNSSTHIYYDDKTRQLTLAMMTDFFNILIAYKWLVAFSRHMITLPNVPLPSTFRNSKSSSV